MKEFRCRACYDEGDKIEKVYLKLFADSKKEALRQMSIFYPDADYIEIEE